MAYIKFNLIVSQGWQFQLNNKLSKLRNSTDIDQLNGRHVLNTCINM